jgi:DNA topoisomerase-6 subunit A
MKSSKSKSNTEDKYVSPNIQKSVLIEQSLRNLLETVSAQLKSGSIPELKIASRSKSNIKQSAEGYWTLSRQKFTKKTLKTKGGAKELLKLVKTIVYLLKQKEQNKTSTLREFYYNALNWISDAQFETVNESNMCIENIQILLNVLREEVGIVAEADGCILGPITLQIRTRDNNKRVVDCQEDVSLSGFLLPRRFQDIKVLSHNAKFVIVCETGGIYSRLIEENFDKKYNCIIIHTKGQSSRCVRKFIKYLNEDLNLKVALFNDCDVWGVLIANTIKYGAIKSCHISDKLCTPNAVHIGLLPSQVEKYKLPGDKITKVEKNMLRLLKEDAKIPEHIRTELDIMDKTEKKAEQQALSFYGLDFVTRVFLPEVLRENNIIE